VTGGVVLVLVVLDLVVSRRTVQFAACCVLRAACCVLRRGLLATSMFAAQFLAPHHMIVCRWL
jgi:hypothetical protein